MTWSMLPAIAGLFIKLYMLVTVSRGPWVSNALVGFVSVFAVQNLVEILGLLSLQNEYSSDYILRVYYVSLITVLVYGFFYAKDNNKHPITKYAAVALASLGAALSILILFTNLVVAGVTTLPYTITAVKGGFYPLVQAFIFLSVSAWFTCLVANYRGSTNPQSEVRHLYSLAAMSPLVIVSLVMLVLMSYGIKVNATMVVPIASTLFLLIIIKGRNSHSGLADPRNTVPFTLERSLAQLLDEASSKYKFEHLSHQELMAALEKAAIEYKLMKNQGNVSKTASSMKIHRSTLYGKFKTLGIRH